MSAGTNLSDYLPFYDAQTDEFKEICETEQSLIDALWQEDAEILREAFVITAENQGLLRLESILGLSSSGLTIDERRENIIFKLMGETPYTMNSLYKMLKLICGGRFVLEYGSEPYTLYVGLGYLSIGQYSVIKSLLYKILPANIGIIIEQIFNTHGEISIFTHGALSELTYIEVREKEI